MSFNRTLTLKTTLAIVIGGVIGSGIFMKPAIIALQLGSPLLLLSVWVIAGIITLFGALSNAEVAAMFPETGGQYVFFQKMYGNFFAYLYGWAAFSVFNTAGNASIAYVFSQYTDYFLHFPRYSHEIEQSFHVNIPFVGTFYPIENIAIKMLTIAVVIGLTLLNSYSVAQSAALQRFLTALKIIAIALLIIGMAFSKQGSTQHFGETLNNSPTGWALISAYIAALSGAFWAYDGWNNITFVAGEVIEPQRVIPKSLFFGLITCICIYILINISYIYMLPFEILANSSFVAADAASIAWGTIGGSLIALLVMLSTFGTTNANILATARITYALGEENRAFSWVGKVHPIFKTPHNALWLNALWSILLILSGSFDMLTDMLIFVTWFFYGASSLGVFILRKKMPNQHRPYRVWGYPIVPMIFVLFTFFFLIMTLISDISNFIEGKSTIINSVFGVFIVFLGIPFYFWKKQEN